MGFSEIIEARYKEAGFDVVTIESADEFLEAVEAAKPRTVILWIERGHRLGVVQVHPTIEFCPDCKAGLVPHTSAGRGFYKTWPRLLWCPGCYSNWSPIFKSSGNVGGLERVPKRKKHQR